MIDTKELRRLAQEAMHPVTKGRWMRLFGERTVYDRMEDGCRGIPVVSTPVSPPHPFEAACLDFIAAANPATINDLLDRLEAVEKERDALHSLVVMRFDHDHPPQFVQGYSPHELNEPVTAEHCRWFVAEIERLRTERDELRAMIQVALVVLDEVCGNINPERGYADELETDVKRAIAALSLYNAKGE